MKSYLITDPKYYTNDINHFASILEYNIQNYNVDMACFRDKISLNYKELAKIFIQTSKKQNVQNIFINQYIDLAKELNASGVHLTSSQFDKIAYAKNLGLKVIISTHNEDEIKEAIKNKVDFITYSPIFNTPNKGNPKGIETLKSIISQYNIPIIALGGIITKEQTKQLKDIDCYGFASIRYFLTKGISPSN